MRLVLSYPDFTEEDDTPSELRTVWQNFIVSGAIQKTVYSSLKSLEGAGTEQLGMSMGVLTVAVSLDYIRELCFRSLQFNSRELLPAVFPCLSICD